MTNAQIAKTITRDYGLSPALPSGVVGRMLTPGLDGEARSMLYTLYGDEHAASIESAILQHDQRYE